MSGRSMNSDFELIKMIKTGGSSSSTYSLSIHYKNIKRTKPTPQRWIFCFFFVPNLIPSDYGKTKTLPLILGKVILRYLRQTTKAQPLSLVTMWLVTHFLTKLTPFWMLPANSFFAFSKPALLMKSKHNINTQSLQTCSYSRILDFKETKNKKNQNGK